jgi:oxygen-dependent protoporphyrinogen oxidase
MSGSRVLVVGGGITGLAAAVELTGHDGVEVELWESSPRLGGKIATSAFGGLAAVDEGADAFLTRVPHAVDFAGKVGLGGADLVVPTSATAMVWHDGMHEIPGGIVLGVPASVRPFATTSLLSWRGKLRAGVEPLLPGTDADDSIGALIRARFGSEVHDRLVDALVGSIYATDTDNASLTLVPQLHELASRSRSLLLGAMKARRRAATSPTSASAGSPIFAAPRRGMGALIDAAAAHAAAAGVSIHLGRPAVSIVAERGRWRVDDEHFDAVVIASPAPAAATLLASVEPAASRHLAEFEQAGVIIARLVLDAGSLATDVLAGHSGYLVPKSRQRLVTAVSFASEKWAHWRLPSGDPVLRVSLGRDRLPVGDLDDDAVIAAIDGEVSGHLGVALAIKEISITRWPDAFPQYRPHHRTRVAAIQAALPSSIALAGASYRGIGIPACIDDGRRAAAAVAAALAAEPSSSAKPQLPQ